MLGSDYDFTKIQVEGRRYFPLRNHHTIALRLWGGSIAGGAPVTEYFYAGGTDTIRGYQDNSFFGTKLIVANLEYRFPIGKIKLLNGAVFADAGNACMEGQPSDIKTSYGVGLRLVFPTLSLGVIRVDYAVGRDGGRSSIGIGQTF